jgi:hypothetical protein
MNEFWELQIASQGRANLCKVHPPREDFFH